MLVSKCNSKSELNLCKRLWNNCFSDESNYVEWYFENIAPQNSVLTIKDDHNNFIGMLHENSYTLKIGNTYTESDYIVGVAISPTHQNQGYFKKLMIESLSMAKEKNYELQFLSPIDKSIYHNLGFSYISLLNEYSLPLKELNIFNKTQDSFIIDKETFYENLYDDLEFAYNNFLEDKFLGVKKSKKDFKNFVDEVFLEEGFFILSKRENLITGFAIVFKLEDIFVKELIYSSLDSLKNILSVLKGYQNYYKNISFLTSENLFFEDLFFSNKNIKKTIKNKIQGRIVNPILTLNRLSKSLLNSENFSVKILDNIFPENNKIFLVEKEKISLLDDKTKNIDLILDIRDLASLAFGFRNIQSLLFQENIFLNNEKREIFDRLFEKKVNYINQDF